MADLSDFLLARIAEDETLAQAAIPGRYFSIAKVGVAGQHRPGSRFLGRWDPARVLAECEAKRRIVAAHYIVERAGAPHCDGCEQWAPCETVRLLALPHADHPDYRQEWKP